MSDTHDPYRAADATGGAPGSDTQPPGHPVGRTPDSVYGAQGTASGTAGLSDKTKVVAGLLQLFLGIFGAGRWYLGWTRIALAQLGLYVLGIALFIGGVTLVTTSAGAQTGQVGGGGVLVPLGWLLCLGAALWALIDAIRMFIGKVPDAQGRPLR